MKVPLMQRVPKEIRELPEEVYQELLETERKYLILLEELRNLSKGLEHYQKSIGSFLWKIK